MKCCLPLLLLALTACGSGTPDQDAKPSVLVTTTHAVRGSEPIWLNAYGSATPLSTALTTLSVNQPGQVIDVLVTPGAGVRQGQPVLRFRLVPSAYSNYLQAQSQLRVAREQLATTQSLLSRQLATRDQLAQAQKNLADAQSALAALDHEGAAQAVQTLVAPFDGVVTTIPVSPGERTQPGAALATIARAGGIVATVGVSPADAVRLQTGARAQLQPLDEGAAMVDGQIERVDQSADPQTRLVDVDVAFKTGAILPGVAVSARLATGEATGWRVPHDAVVTADGESHVFQVVSDAAHAVPVTVLVPGPDHDLVTGALDPARPLVVSGAYQVEDGGAVRTQAAR